VERIYAINEHANRLNWTLLTFFSAFLLQIFLHGALNFLGLSRSAAENKMSEALFRLNVWLQGKKTRLMRARENAKRASDSDNDFYVEQCCEGESDRGSGVC
jgi:hypothetical protein